MSTFTLRAAALLLTSLGVACIACGDPTADETTNESTTRSAVAVATNDSDSDPSRPPPPDGKSGGGCDKGGGDPSRPPPPPPPADAPKCGSCPAATVCCSAPEPCAGYCVPDCRNAADRCPTGSSCDADGVCKRPDGLPPGPPPK